MDWKSLGESLAKIGLPLLGAALPLPGGAALGSALASMIGANGQKPEDVLAAITANVDGMAKAKQFEFQHQEMMLKITVEAEIAQRQADSSDIAAVNNTMQEEAKSEHWVSSSWRGYNGFIFGTTFFGCYFILPLCKIPVPIIPFEAWTAMGAVLGVASWFRGKTQLNQSKAAG